MSARTRAKQFYALFSVQFERRLSVILASILDFRRKFSILVSFFSLLRKRRNKRKKKLVKKLNEAKNHTHFTSEISHSVLYDFFHFVQKIIALHAFKCFVHWTSCLKSVFSVKFQFSERIERKETRQKLCTLQAYEVLLAIENETKMKHLPNENWNGKRWRWRRRQLHSTTTLSMIIKCVIKRIKFALFEQFNSLVSSFYGFHFIRWSFQNFIGFFRVFFFSKYNLSNSI